MPGVLKVSKEARVAAAGRIKIGAEGDDVNVSSRLRHLISPVSEAALGMWRFLWDGELGRVGRRGMTIPGF